MTAPEMGLPAIKRFQRRQECLRGLLTRVVRHALDAHVALAGNRCVGDGDRPCVGIGHRGTPLVVAPCGQCRCAGTSWTVAIEEVEDRVSTRGTTNGRASETRLVWVEVPA